MKKKKEAYTVQLDPDFIEKIDKLADKLGLSRSQFMGNLLQSAYEDVAILDKLGLLTASRTISDLKEKYLGRKTPSEMKGD
jgi:hypothetical protein